MSLQDKKLVCKDCGKEFIHSVKDQEFYAQQGFSNEPQRCFECRKAFKAKRNAGGGNWNKNNNRK